jgi:opacity protein-like surface antigen
MQNKMKKNQNKYLFSGILIFTLLTPSIGQRIYTGITGGFGFPACQMALGPDQKTIYSSSSSSTTYTSKKYSLGKGFDFGIYGGYMFTKNFGAEIGIRYLIGSSFSTINEDDSPVIPNSTTETKVGKLLSITPALRYQVNTGKIHPFITAGLIIGIPKATDEIKDFSGTNTGDDLWTYSGGPTFGFHCSGGITYFLSSKLAISIELAGNYLNWAPGKEILTTSTLNGADRLSMLNTSQKETDYQASYSKDPYSTGTPNNPSISDKIYLPFSSIGFHIGLHICLGKNQ